VTGSVFISYTRADRAYVDQIAAYLTAADVAVWYDHELAVGEQWRRAIRAEIDRCAAFVVVMTPDAEESSWVDREITYAERQRKRIFPLLLRGHPFFRLSDMQFEDVTGERMPSAAFVDTLVRLYRAAGATFVASTVATFGPRTPAGPDPMDLIATSPSSKPDMVGPKLRSVHGAGLDEPVTRAPTEPAGWRRRGLRTSALSLVSMLAVAAVGVALANQPWQREGSVLARSTGHTVAPTTTPVILTGNGATVTVSGQVELDPCSPDALLALDGGRRVAIRAAPGAQVDATLFRSGA
jgi:TIR domain